MEEFDHVYSAIEKRVYYSNKPLTRKQLLAEAANAIMIGSDHQIKNRGNIWVITKGIEV